MLTRLRALISLGILALSLSSCGYIVETVLNTGSSSSKPPMVLFKSQVPQFYHNQTQYTFEWEQAAGASQYVVRIYETSNCSGTPRDPIVWLKSDFQMAGLTNGHTYSIEVAAANSKGSSDWKCSSAVTIDTETPEVDFQAPTTSNSIGTNQFSFQWSAVDHGVSGLSAASSLYDFELYNQSGCAGSKLHSSERQNSDYLLTSMTGGTSYSARVRVRDRAGNVSAWECSAAVTFDNSSATLALTDPNTASATYAYQRIVSASVGNDSSAAKWCLSETQSTQPMTGADACLGGTGTANGWLTARPTSFELSAGEGVKTVYLWVANNSDLIIGGVVNDSISLDLNAPTVLNVTSADADGTYPTGSTLLITVQFTEAIVWNGTTTLELETGDRDAILSLSPNTTSSSLTFSYTVANNHRSADLNYKATTALLLTSGTATDLAGRSVTFALPAIAAVQSLAGSKAFVIADNSAPLAPSGWTMIPGNGSLSNDTTPTITVPIELTEGGSSARLYTDSGCVAAIGSAAIVSSSASVAIQPVTYLSNGTEDGLKSYWGQVTDSSGNVGACGAVASYTLDTVAPTVLSVSTTRANGKYLPGASLDIRVHWSEAVIGSAGPRIATNLSTSTFAAFQTSTSNTTTSVFIATVPSGVAANPDFGYLNASSLGTNGGTLRDAAGNNAVLTLPTPGGGASIQDLASIEIVTDSGLRVQTVADSGGETFPRIDDANPVSITADGKHGYLVSGSFLYQFSRNTTTGALSYVTRLSTGIGFQATSLSLSPESPAMNLYFVGGPTSTSQVQVYSLGAISGTMTLLQTVPMNTLTLNPCVGASKNAVTPDGKFFILSCIWSNSISVFSRSLTDGQLTLLNQYTTDSLGFPAIVEPQLMGVSSDSKFLYFSGRNAAATSGRFMTFELDPLTGLVTHLQTLEPYSILATGNDSGKMVFSPLNNWVYLPCGSAICQFTRNPTTGLLAAVGSVSATTVHALEISADGLSLYYLHADFHGRSRWFRRMAVNSTTGVPVFAQEYHGGTANDWALDFAFGLTVWGDSLYVTAKNHGSVSHYQLAAGTGAPTRISTLVSGSGGGLEFMGWLGGVVADLTNTFLYVFSSGDNAINIFNRSPATGELTINRTYVSGRDMTGLNHVKGGIMDSTNGFLMTCSWRSTATRFYSGTATVNAYSRNVTTGELTLISSDTTNSGVECTSLRISPDDNFLYVHIGGASVSIYQRNLGTGALTFLSTVTVTGGGQQRFSADMKHLYWLVHGSNSVRVYERNVTTGALTLVDTTVSQTGGVGCIHSPVALAVAPNNSHVYVAASGSTGICAANLSTFTRDSTSGVLTFVRKEIENGQNLMTFSAGSSDTWYTINPSGDTMVHKHGNNDTRLYQVDPASGSVREAGSLPFCAYNRYHDSVTFNSALRQFTCTTAPDWEPLPGDVQVVNYPVW